MRAARIEELGRPPAVAEVDEPRDGDAVEILAVALNPLDLSVAAGRFYGGHPELPYVPGCEGVGRRGDALVHLFGGGLGLRRDGTLAERVVPPDGAAVELPGDVDPALACACGIAGMAGWGPVVRADVGADDRVLVLGATGTAGLIALQAARLRGAQRVVAAGRNRDRLERARELGADDVVALDGDDELAARFKAACGGDGPTVVIDPLWGEPARAASEAAAPHARLMQFGQSAGSEATLASSVVRSKELRIEGFSDFALTPEDRRTLYLGLVDEVRAGRIAIEVERFPLERVADAWATQARGAKAVVEL